MSMVEIRDHAIWIKHIHENEPLKERLLLLPAGALIELEVGGLRGMWKKMDDGKDGRPTPGIKALGKARDRWHALQADRGELVTIREIRAVTLVAIVLWYLSPNATWAGLKWVAHPGAAHIRAAAAHCIAARQYASPRWYGSY